MPEPTHTIKVRGTYPHMRQLIALAFEFGGTSRGNSSAEDLARTQLDFYSQKDFEMFTTSAKERGYFNYDEE